MRAERDAVAREHRSQGKKKQHLFKLDVDRKVTLILLMQINCTRITRGSGRCSCPAKLYSDAFAQEPNSLLLCVA